MWLLTGIVADVTEAEGGQIGKRDMTDLFQNVFVIVISCEISALVHNCISSTSILSM